MGNTPPLLVAVQTYTTALEIYLSVSQKIGNISMSRPSYTTPGHVRRISPPFNKDIFMAALFIVDRNWKQSRCPSTEGWIKKIWFIYTIEYFSAIKNKDIMNFTGKWMEIENIILSEVNQT